MLLFIPLIVLGTGTDRPFSTESRSLLSSTLFTEIEAYLTRGNHHLFGSRLNQLNVGIRSLGGQKEYNQIFISGDELIPDVAQPVEVRVRENTQAVLEFADAVGVPTSLMIIPTVSAIRQESLPPFSQTQLFNQRQFIEDIYAQMAGRVNTADIYQALFNVRDQYIYYRTEDNLTALGGFYVYSVLGPRLLEGVVRPNLNDYDIAYAKDDFYGNLYGQSPFRDARADTITLFKYTANPREYLITKNRSGAMSTYHTLYPEHMLDLEREMDIYLGGLSSVTTITSTAPYRGSLLVLGDKTALSWVPFIANHYRTVTLVDLFQLDSAGYEEINPTEYNHVVFAYGIESFMHNNVPSRALRLLEGQEHATPLIPEIELDGIADLPEDAAQS